MQRRTFVSAAAALSVAAALSFLLPLASSAQVSPGDTIDRTKIDKVKEITSPGVQAAVDNGMELNIVAYEKIVTSAVYDQATEQYSGQVTLDDRNGLVNWVAARPFPKLDPADPKIGTKVMWNFGRNPYFTDDFNVHLPDADTGAFFLDHEGKRKYQVERHFIADWSRRLRLQGRLRHDPKPVMTDNPDKVFEKAAFYPLIEPFDLKGVGTVSFRYLDPTRQDDTWLYTPAIRRVRRLSSAQRSDALFGQDIDIDSFGGYAGQIQWFDWKLIGSKSMLGSVHGQNLPPKICPNDGGATYCENWEMRPDVWIVEGTPKIPGYAYSKRVIFLDSEIYLVLYSDLYDHNDELWKTILLNIRTSKKPNPKLNFEYEEVRNFVYAFTVLDLQLGHGTRAAIPGMGFPDEPGWYLDRGFDAPEAVPQSWFQVSSLISAGR